MKCNITAYFSTVQLTYVLNLQSNTLKSDNLNITEWHHMLKYSSTLYKNIVLINTVWVWLKTIYYIECIFNCIHIEIYFG